MLIPGAPLISGKVLDVWLSEIDTKRSPANFGYTVQISHGRGSGFGVVVFAEALPTWVNLQSRCVALAVEALRTESFGLVAVAVDNVPERNDGARNFKDTLDFLFCSVVGLSEVPKVSRFSHSAGSNSRPASQPASSSLSAYEVSDKDDSCLARIFCHIICFLFTVWRRVKSNSAIKYRFALLQTANEYKNERRAGHRLKWKGITAMQVDSEHGQQASSSLAAPKPSAGLRQLALELHTLRTAGQDSDAEGRNDILKRALPLFAMARSQLRSSATASRIDRTRIAATRSTMDAAFLALQSRKYEMNHLYREIEKCNDYECVAAVIAETRMLEGFATTILTLTLYTFPHPSFNLCPARFIKMCRSLASRTLSTTATTNSMLIRIFEWLPACDTK